MRMYRLPVFCVAVLMVPLLAFGGVPVAEQNDAATIAKVKAIQQTAARAEALVHNLSCTTRFDDWRRQGKDEQEFPGDHKGWTRRREWGTFGWNERGQMRIDQDFLYADGQGKYDRTQTRVKVYKTWNGIEERDSFNDGPIVISEKNTAREVRNPADFARVGKESLAAFLERALKEQWPMTLAEDGASTWTLAVRPPAAGKGDEWRLSLDPTKAYYLTRGERRRNGSLAEKWESTPQECCESKDTVAVGVWFPKQGRWQTFVEEKGKANLDAECELLMWREVFVYSNKVQTSKFYYTLPTDPEKIAGYLGCELPGLSRNFYFGVKRYPEAEDVLVRFDLPAAEFERFFNGKGHLPAAKDFKTDHTGPKPVNGSLREHFNSAWHLKDTGGVFAYPWWRPEELHSPVFGWTEEFRPDGNPRYMFRSQYFFAVGKEDRGYRRVYFLYEWRE